MIRRTRPLVLLLSVCVACSLSGCGGGGPSDMPDIGTVSGTVALDGALLANAVVTFEPQEGRPSGGVTDEEGYYELQYTSHTSGAKVGQHTVRITRGGDMDEMLLLGDLEPGGEPKQTAPAETPLPAKYNSESTLNVEVEAGSNEFSFELLSDGR